MRRDPDGADDPERPPCRCAHTGAEALSLF